MLVGLKKNVFVGKFAEASDVPEGVEAIGSAADLAGRTLKSLTALFIKVFPAPAEGAEPVKFETVELATAAVYAALEAYEPPVKEKKEKVVREKLELIEVPKHIGKQSIILSVVENPKRGGAAERFAHYAVGKTIADVMALGIRSDDVRWDYARKFITLELVEDVKPEPVAPAEGEAPKKAKKGKKEEAPAEA